ncbi:MAG: hypothetical protein ACLR23_22920 [Clostridia bacterium]
MALGESLYEKGGDTYEVLSLLTRGEMEPWAAAHGGDSFRRRGHPDTAASARMATWIPPKCSWHSFEKQVRREAYRASALPNMEALKCRLALCRGATGKPRSAALWRPPRMRTRSSCVLERYRYLAKVRCYLSTGDPSSKAPAWCGKNALCAPDNASVPHIHMETELPLTAVTRFLAGERNGKRRFRRCCGKPADTGSCAFISEERSCG